MATDFDLDILKRQLLRKYPAFGTTIVNVKYQIVEPNHPCQTAATDGQTIYLNAQYFTALTPAEQLMVMAHEVCHLALHHIPRSQGKVPDVWNIATDAVINQYLKKDGLPLVQGGVDIPEAIQYDAEEMYRRLFQPENHPQREQWQNGGHDDHQDWVKTQQQNEQSGHDDNQTWEKAQQQNGQDNQAQPVNQDSQDRQQQNNAADHPDQATQPISEKQIFAENEAMKTARANQVMQKLRGLRGSFDRETGFKDLGNDAKPVVNWKKLLRQALEIEDEAWGHRFSDHTNHYTARIQDVEYDNHAETEIILDTSSSVDTNLLRNFLRQVKTILRDSAIKVGTFSDNFHGFQTVKTAADIDNLRLKVGGWTNFDAASRAFTKARDVNKICFTDGKDNGNAQIQNQRRDIIWISCVNPNFKPDYGKVIYVPSSQLEQFTQTPEPERTR